MKCKTREGLYSNPMPISKKPLDISKSAKPSQTHCGVFIHLMSARWEKQLEKSMPSDLKRSLEMCKKIVKEHRIEGVYGTVGELISCREQYFTAVEVAARTHLFSMVVESVDIAEQIIRYLIRDKLGRVTFIPLDKIRAEERPVMESLGSQAFPLLRVLKIDDRASPVLNHVFGKTVLASDLDVAYEISQQGFNCVTVEGDEVRKNGAMKGGYYDPTKSKMKAMKEMSRAMEELTRKQNERTETGRSLDELDQQISQCLAQIDNLNLSSLHQQAKLQQVAFVRRYGSCC